MFNSPNSPARSRSPLDPSSANSASSAIKFAFAPVPHRPCVSPGRSEGPSASAILFRIIFFAFPRHLTPIESYSCEKQGVGYPTSHSFAISVHRSLRAATPVTTLFSCVYLTFLWIPRGVGSHATPHSSLATSPHIEILILISARGRRIQRWPRRETPCQLLPSCIDSSGTKALPTKPGELGHKR